MTAEVDKRHLVERAAERLLRSGIGATAAILSPASSPLHAKTSPPPSIALDAGALARAGLFIASSERTRAAEELRLVQQQVLRTAFPSSESGRGRANLLMVTSARPQEGKSFTALNLAASLARNADRSVTLIDADPKPGCLSDALGEGKRPGLLELALDPARDFARLVLVTAFSRMTFLPVGLERESSPEAFASRHMARLLNDLSSRFPDRLFILDAAPCLSTSDASALAPLVGQTVFVIEAERTQRSEVEAALDLIEPCRAISVLLNKVRTATRNSFGAYAHAYYSNRLAA